MPELAANIVKPPALMAELEPDLNLLLLLTCMLMGGGAWALYLSADIAHDRAGQQHADDDGGAECDRSGVIGRNREDHNFLCLPLPAAWGAAKAHEHRDTMG